MAKVLADEVYRKDKGPLLPFLILAPADFLTSQMEVMAPQISSI